MLTFGLGIIILQDVSRRKPLAGVNIMFQGINAFSVFSSKNLGPQRVNTS
jgi:hypothetical protein